MKLNTWVIYLIFISLSLTAFAGKIAIVKYPPDGPGDWGAYYHSLADTLLQEGHEVDYDRHFGWREPRGYNSYFLVINNYLTSSQVDSLQSYLTLGGRLILQENGYYPRTSDYLSVDGWPCYTGNPYWNIIYPTDTLPSVWADSIDPDGGIVWTVSFATEFSSSWEPARGIDTLTSCWFITYTFEDSGALKAVAFGGADASTSLYDSFPPVILSGQCGRGDIVVLGGQCLLCDIPTPVYPDCFNMLRFHDNCQFARQLFQCNERADSAWLILENDSTAKVYLEHDSLIYMPDSSYWEVRFFVDTIRNYTFYGHEFDAEGFEDSLAVTFRPGYFYDTVEVCLARLPDSTGETILPCGRICDTFPERSIVAETRLPEGFSLSVRPNPFNSSCRICAPFGSKIEIFDINGRLVYEMPVGARHISPVVWSPEKTIGSGIYLIRIKNGGMIYTKPVVYIK